MITIAQAIEKKSYKDPGDIKGAELLQWLCTEKLALSGLEALAFISEATVESYLPPAYARAACRIGADLLRSNGYSADRIIPPPFS